MKRSRPLPVRGRRPGLGDRLGPAAPPQASEWLGGGGLLIGIPLGDFADATDEGFGVVGHVVFTPGVGRSASASRRAASSTAAGDRARRCPGRAGSSPRTSRPTTGCSMPGSAPRSCSARARSAPTRTRSPASATSRPRRPSATATTTTGTTSTTNYDDTTFAWSAGAGLLFPVSRSVAIDVGVQYVGNGTVRYLAEGDLRPSPGGAPPVIVPRKTEANLSPSRSE